MVATSGFELSGLNAMRALQQHLLPLATLLTPNLDEARTLTGLRVDSPEEMEAAGRKLLEQGCPAVLMKGGHLKSGTITDLLITRAAVVPFSHPAQTGSYHGTGCTLSAAIAARLAKGESLNSAVSGAIGFVQECIRLSHSPERGEIRLLGLPLPTAR
jgi:hydroxymethylpyrimidine/phosphomethylpyrimidine kinase